MEFFAELEHPGLKAEVLQRELRIASLPQHCASISTLLVDEGERGEVFCVWGQFRVNREVLRYGVRFSLPDCLNALVWSITCDADSDTVVIHCSINRRQQDEDFVESIEQFVADWQQGLQRLAPLPE